MRKPGILLVDEFDAVISQETVSVIDGLMEKEFTGATILLVTHRKRSGIKADLQLTVGKTGGKFMDRKNVVRQGCRFFRCGNSD